MYIAKEPIDTIDDSTPSPTAYHITECIDGRMFVFGGTGSRKFDSNFTNALHVWDLDAREWHQVETTGTQPTPRALSASCVMNGKLFIFGGYDIDDSAYRCFRGFYSLDTDSMEWSKIEGEGDVPEARSGASLVAFKDKLYLYGGSQGTSYFFNDIHEYDPQTNTWTQLSTIGRPPPSRCGHTAAVVGNEMYVYGGWTPIKHHRSPRHRQAPTNTLYAFDLMSFNWMEIKPKGKTPIPRTGHCMVTLAPYIIIAGGVTTENRLTSSIQTYHVDRNSWMEMKYEGELKPTVGLSSCLDRLNNRILFYGGRDADSVTSTITRLSMSRRPLTPLRSTMSPNSQLLPQSKTKSSIGIQQFKKAPIPTIRRLLFDDRNSFTSRKRSNSEIEECASLFK